MGEVTQTLDVVGTAPVIDTESPTIGSVIDQKKVVELPLNGRNFMELALLSQGINEAGGSTAKTGFLRKGFAPSAAGMPTTENNYQLDGADNKEGFFNTFNVAPSVDAVQEFKIQIGQYSAEFGSGGGAVINVVTKSGTNGFHGTSGSSSATTNWMRAISSSRQQRGRLRCGEISSASLRAVRSRKIARSSLATTMAPVNGAVCSAAHASLRPQRSRGDLSSLGKMIMDPVTGLPFPNNIIPANRIDPISAGLAKYYDAPNNPSGTIQNYIANLIQQRRWGFLSAPCGPSSCQASTTSCRATHFRIARSTRLEPSLESAAPNSATIPEYCPRAHQHADTESVERSPLQLRTNRKPATGAEYRKPDRSRPWHSLCAPR